ncbi:MAG: hypothetical protein Q8Q09_27605 [Deltaproteobacteria bacterium]|nr:hypothetical protein [Deltaproteobacteria bacterium]
MSLSSVLSLRARVSVLALMSAGCAIGVNPAGPDVVRSDGQTDAALGQDGFAMDRVMPPGDVAVMPPLDAQSADVVPALCAAGLRLCGTICVDLQRDSRNCGDCDVTCRGLGGAMGTCVAGVCNSTCLAGRGDCNGRVDDGCETDVASSLANCGSCGRACAPANGMGTCMAGRCALAGCTAGFADCNGLASDGCEQALQSSVEHCGACGQRCAPAQSTGVCTAGRCGVATCARGFGDCNGSASDGCEQSLEVPTHCGGCGRACAFANGSGACTGGVCTVSSCSAGFADCDGNGSNGCEVNTRTDPSHCGGCGLRPAESCNLVDDNCDGRCDETAGCRTGVHRSVHLSTGEHFYTTSLAESVCCGFRREYENFYYLYSGAAPGLVPFMRCVTPAGWHFYTADPACEGVRVEGPMGFISTSPACGAVPLYRLVLREDHFYTTSTAERDSAIGSGYVSEGLAGYVWLTPAGS